MAGFLDFLDNDGIKGLGWGDIGATLSKGSDFLFGKKDTTVPGMSDIYNNKRMGTQGLFGDITDLVGLTGTNASTDRFGNLVQGLGAFGNYQVNKENAEIAKRNNALQELAFAEEQQRYDDAVAKDEEDSALMSSGLRSATTKRKSGNLDPYVDQYQKTS